MVSEDLILLLRGVIQDDGATETYSDEQLSKALVTSGLLVCNEVNLSVDYIFNISASTITPDPMADPMDTQFVGLVLLRAACLITRAEQKKKAGGVVVKDGPNTFDTTRQGDSTKGVADDFCKQYTEAKLQFSMGSSGGYFVISPFRLGIGQQPPYTYGGHRGGC